MWSYDISPFLTHIAGETTLGARVAFVNIYLHQGSSSSVSTEPKPGLVSCKWSSILYFTAISVDSLDTFTPTLTG